MAGVIPTLFVNQTTVSTPQDIVAYLLKFLLFNPGWTSSQIESKLLSIRKFVAKNTEDINTLPGVLQSALSDAVKNYFPEYNASVTANQIGDNTYNLEIAVTDVFGATILASNDFVVDNGEFKLLSEIRAQEEN